MKKKFLPPVIFLSLLSLPSCLTYQVAKEEVWPGVKQTIMGAGPHLFEALFKDIANLLGWPVEQVESLLTPKKPELVPPTQ